MRRAALSSQSCRMHQFLRLSAAFAFVASILASLAGCQNPRQEQRAQHAELATLMTGSFSSAAQHERLPEDYFDIHLTMTPIWPELTTPDQAWFYVEQAVATARDKPYRQRMYRVAPLPADKQIEISLPGDGPERSAKAMFVSEVYKLPTPQAYINADGDPARFAALKPEMLERLSGCDVLLARVAPNLFEGGTQGEGCTSSAMRGAKYVVSQVRIASEGLRAWDRGFDDKAQHVWGAEKGPYEFERE